MFIYLDSIGKDSHLILTGGILGKYKIQWKEKYNNTGKNDPNGSNFDDDLYSIESFAKIGDETIESYIDKVD